MVYNFKIYDNVVKVCLCVINYLLFFFFCQFCPVAVKNHCSPTSHYRVTGLHLSMNVV